MKKIKITYHQLEYFVNINKISCARFYFYVKAHYNNQIHTEDIAAIAIALGTSKSAIRKNMNQLIELGWMINYSEGYWYIKSSKYFFDPKIRNKNKYISLEELRDVKKLRTLFYAIAYDTCQRIIKYMMFKERDKNTMLGENGLYKISADYVKTSLGLKSSLKTILKHCSRSNLYGFLRVKQDRLTFGSYMNRDEAFFNRNEIQRLEQDKYIRVSRPYNGLYYVYAYLPNWVCSNL